MSRSIIPRKDKGEKNRPPPPSSYSARAQEVSDKPRRVRNVTTAADYAELERCYTFAPSTENDSSSWQQRMVNKYHSHLYKEYVLADLTSNPGQVGLRWRTKTEVQQGKGHDTCGNKHCPSYNNQVAESRREIDAVLSAYYLSSAPASEEEELGLLENVRHGFGLHDYEVHFAYVEGGTRKNELVKLRLCLRCAPLLFHNKGGALGARQARNAKERGAEEKASSNRPQDESDLDETSSDDDSRIERKRKKHKKRKSRKHTRRKKHTIDSDDVNAQS